MHETWLDTREEDIGSAWIKPKVNIHDGSEDERLTRRTRQMKVGESARELRFSMIH